ncbi:hypothetical protein FHG87_016371 [Trinorchestia longiramus]|nr:hypothetical protein FHG87_016371 [Trinorchestia longiramus]
MIASDLEDQPMDLSTGPRLESVIRRTTFFTPATASKGEKLSPTVPFPPTKRSYDAVRSEENDSRTPVSAAACPISSTSPRTRVKRQRLHSPDTVSEQILGLTKRKNEHIFEKNGLEFNIFNSSNANIGQKKRDPTEDSYKDFTSSDQTQRLRRYAEVISQGYGAETRNEVQYRESSGNETRNDVSTPVEAWNETTQTDHPDNTPDSRVESSFNSTLPWNFENGAVCSPDGIYNAYMYLNYLPYLLSENSSPERPRLNELLKMSGAPKQADFPPQAPTAIGNIYSAYLASLLLPHNNASMETPVTEPNHSVVSRPSLTESSTKLLEDAGSEASHSNQSRPSMQKCLSDPSSYLASPEFRLDLKPQFYTRKNTSNETFTHLHQKKQFVRASSFDDSLVRGHNSDELFADYDRKFAYSNWLHGYDVNKYNLLRANNSMPNLPSCSHDIPGQSPIASTSSNRLGDFVNRFDNPLNRITSLQTECPSHTNTINIKNFNIFRDLYSVNDVNNFLKKNLSDQTGEVVEPCGGTKEKTGGHSPEARMLHQLCSVDQDRRTDMVQAPMPSSTKMMSGLMIKKKPTRALTGRHVRSGTGASISTLASLREKLEERKNRTPPSTPASSRPSTRGRGRRKLPL